MTYMMCTEEQCLPQADLEVKGRVKIVAGIPTATVPDDVPPGTRYDEIWSNPPIRIGKPALHELLATWLPRLKPDGMAWLVVGRNLGADSLQAWLIAQGWATERIASAKGFRVFKVTRADQS